MISVIMSTYKEPMRYIEQAISSILNQSYSDLELIIIVDFPDNMELIDYLKKVSIEDHRLVFSINERNLGLTASLNKAKNLAHGDFLARMDADDISEPDRLKDQLDFLAKNNYDLVGCNVIDIDEDDRVINPKGTNYPTHNEAIRDFLRINSAVLHPTWLVKKEIYDRFDYIDFPACEDYEFLTRVALSGYKFGNIAKLSLRYRLNTKGISSSKKSLQKTSFYYVRNNYRKGLISNFSDFMEYISRPSGKRKKKSLEKYYAETSKLKELKRDGKKIEFLICGCRLFLLSNEAREIILNKIMEHIIKIKFGKDY